MKTLGVIPARGGSKGVPGKNIKMLAGEPLISYTIENALKSKIDDVVVSTDSQEIATISKSLGAQVPFIRPSSLATDTSKSIDVVRHCLILMEEQNETTYDLVMLLQPTTPLRSIEDIDNTILKIFDENCDSVISVVDVGAFHPARMKFIQNDRLLDPPFCEDYENQPRQELTPMYIRNGAIYLTKRATILANSFKGEYSKAYIMPQDRSINIDTFWDFQLAEILINQANENSTS